MKTSHGREKFHQSKNMGIPFMGIPFISGVRVNNETSVNLKIPN